jgi:NAD-reducing hydrogenase large subunit
VVPGGVSEALTEEKRDRILAMIPDGIAIAQRTLEWFKAALDNYEEEIKTFANFPSLFMGLVGEYGNLELYDGVLRIVDSKGVNIQDFDEPENYLDIIGEAVEPYSYLKSPYYKPLGYPDGMYRVGPLARLNIATHCGTPLADVELREFRSVDRLSSFHFHYARLIEILYCMEAIERLLNEPDILSDHVRAYAQPNREMGVGISEAPRGTLMHHYEIDRNGLITRVNLIIATGHNNLAMNRGVLQVAKHFVNGKKLTDGMLNRVEAVIRAYDPCLSCSTHAIGQMPMQIQLLNPDGTLVSELRR